MPDHHLDRQFDKFVTDTWQVVVLFFDWHEAEIDREVSEFAQLTFLRLVVCGV